MWLRLLPWAGWPLAAAIFVLWLDARDDLAAEIERCNADKLASIAEAERIVRTASKEAYEARLAELTRRAAKANEAREIAERAAQEARERTIETRTIVREIASADPEGCLNQPLPAVIIDSLR